MTKFYIAIIIIATVVISSCRFSSTSTGSIRIATTKDSLEIVAKEVQQIVESLNHKEIKEKTIQKFPDFGDANILNSYIRYRQFWNVDTEVKEATLIIMIQMNTNPIKSEGGLDVIKYYESFIVPELEKHGFTVDND